MSIILVFGATGAQGGSVVRRLLATPKYKVRALTRNTDSEAAKKLAAQGVEVVAGDINNEASLKPAFEGVDGAFVVTAYWPSIMSLGRDGAGKEEVEQYQNVARVAAASPTLKHLVLSTLPSADKVSGGKFKVPHFDYKQVAVDWIKANFPELWAKTTEFLPGFYTSNFAFFPMLRPTEIPNTYGGHILPIPSKLEALLPTAGDLEHNAGVVVEGIFNTGAAAFSKAAILVPDYVSVKDAVAKVAELSGKRIGLVDTPDDAYATIFGVYGEEIASQLRWSEEYPKWEAFYDPSYLITLEQLGVKNDIIGFEANLATFKDKL
ncbi:hypothetical protein B0H63DRAFT_160484 [Podospora didyma]|uniref:NmrA-like domain-containing protein n=1 Tax=Podospora didyma TaxID=330526 RepID=A0AAE0U1N7_9PEZI|nr:hypothetical protein B0H63DRAFT_160484 [Podospora didyma]